MLRPLFAVVLSAIVIAAHGITEFVPQSRAADAPAKITHSFLATGGETYILDGDGKVTWSYPKSTRDGWVLPNGNILLALSKSNDGGSVVEVTREGKTVFEFKGTQAEVNTAQALENGNILLTEAGAKPRLLEVTRDGKIAVEVALQAQTKDHHLQTRMARKLKNGNYLVPHLLAFAIKEYRADGQVVQTLKTDLEEIGGRKVGNWPFTAIRLENGNTLTTLTNGLKVVELDAQGAVVWKVTTDEVQGLLRDPCGAQRLANGNTVGLLTMPPRAKAQK